MRGNYLTLLSGGMVALTVLGCGAGEEQRERPRREVPSLTAESEGGGGGGEAAAAAGSAEGWGNIKGRIVWDGDVPSPVYADVTKDQEWCLAEGKVLDQEKTLKINPDNKGIANVVVFIKKADRIHPDYPQDAKATAEADAKAFQEQNGVSYDELAAAIRDGKVKMRDLKAASLIDQVRCAYVPYAVVAREGQKTLVLNPEEITHNVKVSSISGKNEANPNMPANTFQVFDWKAESQPLSIACSIHGWMKMFGMVFDHPYYAVTNENGEFELKNVPAGTVTVVMRAPQYIDPKKGGKGTAKGADFKVADGQTVELGEVKYSAQ